MSKVSSVRSGSCLSTATGADGGAKKPVIPIELLEGPCDVGGAADRRRRPNLLVMVLRSRPSSRPSDFAGRAGAPSALTTGRKSTCWTCAAE